MARIALCLSLVLGLAACETTRGFVQDSKNVGRAVVGG